MNEDNNNYDEEFARIHEALTVEKHLVPAGMPPYFGGFVGDYNSWSRNMFEGWRVNLKHLENAFDTVYLNKDGQRHRIFGPAYVSEVYDVRMWYRDGKFHREGGPAISHKTTFWWFKEGKPHNLYGPAGVSGGTPPQYYIDGRKYSPREYKKEISRMRKRGLIK